MCADSLSAFKCILYASSSKWSFNDENALFLMTDRERPFDCEASSSPILCAQFLTLYSSRLSRSCRSCVYLLSCVTSVVVGPPSNSIFPCFFFPFSSSVVGFLEILSWWAKAEELCRHAHGCAHSALFLSPSSRAPSPRVLNQATHLQILHPHPLSLPLSFCLFSPPFLLHWAAIHILLLGPMVVIPNLLGSPFDVPFKGCLCCCRR